MGDRRPEADGSDRTGYGGQWHKGIPPQLRSPNALRPSVFRLRGKADNIIKGQLISTKENAPF